MSTSTETTEPASNNQFFITEYQQGYKNKKGVAVPSANPSRVVTIKDVYNYIVSDVAKEATMKLREIDDHAEGQRFKALNFKAVSPAGIFSYRKADNLQLHSGLMVIDIDNITSQKRLREMREQLLHDDEFETELLFVSPGGRGLKWIIYVGDMGGRLHSDCFKIIKKYLWDRYRIEADKSGSDVCRICYLPYDPNCYINPELL